MTRTSTPLKRGDQLEVAIERLAFGGDGLGKYDGIVTFVPNVVPGDRVKISLDKIKKNRLEWSVVEMLEASPLRIVPRCRHFEVCGGCTWQNLSYPDQLKFKHQQVEETLQHLGGFSLRPGVMQPILGCAEPWGYRNKMEFSFGAEGELGDDGDLMLGLHLPGRRYDVFNIEECFLPSEKFAEVVREVREWAQKEGLKVFRSKTNEGFLRNLIIREGQNTGELMVNLVTSDEEFPAGVKERFIERLMSDSDSTRPITSLLWTRVKQGKGRTTTREVSVLAKSSILHEELRLPGGQILRFDIASEAFFQTNTFQAEKLYAEAVQAAGLTGEEVVYDLYCGTGTIGLFCTPMAKQVYGVELNGEAVKNGRKNAEHNGISNIMFVENDVGKFVKAPPKIPPPDVVIVDPPRSGLAGDAPHHVAALKAPRLVYISCNPATLARDLRTLVDAGYELVRVQPVDMFPHTTHIETVVLLNRS